MGNDVVIVDGARTAIGAFNGSLKDFQAYDLGSIAIKGLLEKSGVKPELIDEVVMGCIAQASENAFMSRLAALKAGLPISSSAMTVNRLLVGGEQDGVG